MKTPKIFFPMVLVFLLLTPTVGRCDLSLSWDKNAISDGVTQYNVYLSTVSSGDLDTKRTNNQPTLTVPATRSSLCVTSAQFAFSDVVYAAVSAVNSTTQSSLSNRAYYLRGNVYDRYNVTTGKVDVLDMQTLQLYFGKTVTHKIVDCNADFVLINQTDLQAADINRDGRVDFRDQVEVGLKFGNATQ